ncbi:hypothetical protein BJX68DRAFT_57628 [Aspergillus pseudodeflectus]|uniref:Uncharacterized protein n=1 Tax=Aspergillus pseudodeflectus TaxID=176178 RepID=A0ABR4KKB6_9EURO
MFVNLFSSTLSYFSSCIFAIVIFHIAFLGLIIGIWRCVMDDWTVQGMGSNGFAF